MAGVGWGQIAHGPSMPGTEIQVQSRGNGESPVSLGRERCEASGNVQSEQEVG